MGAASTSETNPRRRLLAIIAAAFVLRLVLLVPAHDVRPLRDSLDYILIATSLAERGEYGPWGRAPGYPLLLAGTFRMTEGLGLPIRPSRRASGDEITALDVARFVQVLASTLSVWLAFALGRRLYDARAGMVAAALMAFYPNFVGYSHLLWTETFYITLTLAWALLLHRGVVDGRRAALVGAGLCLGYAALIREIGLPTIGVAVLWTWLVARSPWRRTLAQTAVVVVMAALVILPWAIRNYRVHGELVLSASTRGLALLWGATDDILGEIRQLRKAEGGKRFQPVFSPEMDARAGARAREIIAADPAAWRHRIWTVNLPGLWHPGYDGVISHLTLRFGYDFRAPWIAPTGIVLVVGSYLLLGTLAAIGLALSRSREAVWLVLGLALLYSATHAIAGGLPRHRLPVMALATLPAGYLLSRRRLELASVLSAARVVVALLGVALFLSTVDRNDDQFLEKAWERAQAGPPEQPPRRVSPARRGPGN